MSELTNVPPSVNVPAKYRKSESATAGYVQGVTAPRSLSTIAREIRRDWQNVYFGAVPYLDAMRAMDKVTEPYGCDSGESVVLYFMSNATKWRGETAKRIKAELQAMLDSARH